MVKVRKILCQPGVHKTGYAGTEAARLLGISTSAVNRMASFAERPELKEITE